MFLSLSGLDTFRRFALWCGLGFGAVVGFGGLVFWWLVWLVAWFGLCACVLGFSVGCWCWLVVLRLFVTGFDCRFWPVVLVECFCCGVLVGWRCGWFCFAGYGLWDVSVWSVVFCVLFGYCVWWFALNSVWGGHLVLGSFVCGVLVIIWLLRMVGFGGCDCGVVICFSGLPLLCVLLYDTCGLARFFVLFGLF